MLLWTLIRELLSYSPRSLGYCSVTSTFLFLCEPLSMGSIYTLACGSSLFEFYKCSTHYDTSNLDYDAIFLRLGTRKYTKAHLVLYTSLSISSARRVRSLGVILTLHNSDGWILLFRIGGYKHRTPSNLIRFYHFYRLCIIILNTYDIILWLCYWLANLCTQRTIHLVWQLSKNITAVSWHSIAFLEYWYVIPV